MSTQTVRRYAAIEAVPSGSTSQRLVYSLLEERQGAAPSVFLLECRYLELAQGQPVAERVTTSGSLGHDYRRAAALFDLLARCPVALSAEQLTCITQLAWSQSSTARRSAEATRPKGQLPAAGKVVPIFTQSKV